MAHPRQLIRDAVVTRLKNLIPEVGNKVFVEDRRRIRRDELPAIVVFSGNENSEHNQTAPRELERSGEVIIEAWASDTIGKTAADARDDLALRIETLIHADPFLGGAAGDCYLSGTEVDVDADGDRIIGMATLTYAVTYRTLAPEAPELLDDFLTADVRHRRDGITDVTDPAHVLDGHDEVVVQEIAP